MKKILLLIGMLSSNYILDAQIIEKKTLHAGDDLLSLSYYLFPEFSDATVNLKNGSKLTSKMNFNLLTCQMQFINAKSDTLELSKPAEIDSIHLNKSVFFYNVCYNEIFATGNKVKLLAQRKVIYQPIKIGALGLPNENGTGITDFTSFVSPMGEKNLVMNEDVKIIKETTYFLLTPAGKKMKANKTNFLNLFSNNQQQLEDYIKQNKTNFNNQADLLKLFSFCESL